MSVIESGWFREINEQWAGYSVGLQVEKVLFQGKSDYQDILIFKSTTFGNVLVLDGCIQCTERDECCYQEMIAHLPLCCHSNPTEVLVVGGGDGGVVREVLKHKSVEKVTLCEIDDAKVLKGVSTGVKILIYEGLPAGYRKKVIELCKQYLPDMAGCLDDPRVKIHVGDGVQYMKEHKNSFDVIITDAPDPIGVAKGLYELEYYKCLKTALKPNGIICSQGENLWLDLDIVKSLLSTCRNVFPSSGFAFAGMPTYASGQIGFIMASTNPDLDFTKPVRTFTEAEVLKLQLKFYNPEIHSASFVLPQFAKVALSPAAMDQLNGDV